MKYKTLTILLLSALSALLLTFCSQSSGGVSAFTNVNLIPMTSERIVKNQTVLVRDSKIIAVGDADRLRIPKNAQVIDSQGAYLMPGLADMHMHTRADWEDRDIWPVHPLNLYLANGVTTIRDFSPDGSPLNYALLWRDEIDAGNRKGPTIYASGKLLYASPLDDPADVVNQNNELGFDFLKLYSYLSKDDFKHAMRAAKAHGMYTSGHIPFTVGLEGVLAEEMDEIAHVEELLYEFIEFDRDRQLTPEAWMAYLAEAAVLQFGTSSTNLIETFEFDNKDDLDQIAQQIRSENIPVCTTMIVDDVIQSKLFSLETFMSKPENKYFEIGYLESLQQGNEKHQRQCKGAEGICALKYDIDRWILDGLHDAGVMLLLGTDSGTGGMGIHPGFSIHDELRILVENGFTPYEALLTGTVNAAIVVERMNGDGNFGTIEVGKRADLILVRENPLENLSALETPLGVMAAGQWFSTEMLNKLIEISKPGS